MGFHMHGPGGGRLDMDDISFKDVNFKHLGRTKEFLLPFWWQLSLAMVLVVAIAALGLEGPVIIGKVVDLIQLSDTTNQQLYSLVALYFGVQVLIAVLRYAQTYIMSWTGQKILYSMRKKLFVHLQDLGLDFYDKLQAGRIMSRVTNDVEAINQLLSGGSLSLLSDVVTIFGIITVMLRMNSRLALVTFITVPLLFLTIYSLQGKMTRAYHKTRRRLADITANLQESISGMRIIQAFSREDLNAERFSNTNEQNFRAQMEAARLRAIFFPLVDVIGTLGVALVYYYGGIRMSLGDTLVSVGTITVFVNYTNRFFWPVRNLVEVWDLILQAAVSSERVFEILDTKPNVVDKPGAIDLGRVQGHVEFKNVTFGYDPSLPVLHNVNIEAKPDETIALVGPTGAGKSSIINLLCRFYDVQSGQILVDGHDIRDVTIQSLRQNLGIVLQDTVLFSGTIRENIRYGRLDATDEEVEEAAKIVGAHEFIMRQPEGYDTQVRERGSRLSVGQRQLLAFARALLANPRILILDEATSSVDAYTELQIQRALEKLLKGRTSIVIAHRLSTIRNADRIYVIDHGTVKEVGTHEELIAQNGLYKSLYEKQFAGEPEDYKAAPVVDMTEAKARLGGHSQPGTGVRVAMENSNSADH
ncbi:MAG: ABC transporter ATP-binding protein [Candidatus Fermentithermobacillus carboniphilus]|uniref:ABC transporter ATP-binding protein n=1 Tax=Candidatus Fermentithermobacillus carboniphilus TaxID=3085328 RepID=A0AAT9LD75_9FIRM|nr:MAG: ABC transporter ATP-binding protein [Candidatus Fermentithermobacillus carboniphilus]